MFDLQEHQNKIKEGDITATKMSKYPNWPQVAKVLSANGNGTEVRERIRRKDILFVVDLKDSYLSKNDRVKINSFK